MIFHTTTCKMVESKQSSVKSPFFPLAERIIYTVADDFIQRSVCPDVDVVPRRLRRRRRCPGCWRSCSRYSAPPLCEIQYSNQNPRGNGGRGRGGSGIRAVSVPRERGEEGRGGERRGWRWRFAGMYRRTKLSRRAATGTKTRRARGGRGRGNEMRTSGD